MKIFYWLFYRIDTKGFEIFDCRLSILPKKNTKNAKNSHGFPARRDRLHCFFTAETAEVLDADSKAMQKSKCKYQNCGIPARRDGVLTAEGGFSRSYFGLIIDAGEWGFTIADCRLSI